MNKKEAPLPLLLIRYVIANPSQIVRVWRLRSDPFFCSRYCKNIQCLHVRRIPTSRSAHATLFGQGGDGVPHVRATQDLGGSRVSPSTTQNRL